MKLSMSYYALANLIARGLVLDVTGDHFTEVKKALEKETEAYKPSIGDYVLYIDPLLANIGEYLVTSTNDARTLSIKLAGKQTDPFEVSLSEVFPLET